jgi:hypothetical protein
MKDGPHQPGWRVLRSHERLPQGARREVRGPRLPSRPAHLGGALPLLRLADVGQPFIDGELIGGRDSVTEMCETGGPEEKLGVAQPEYVEAPESAPVQRAPIGLENRLAESLPRRPDRAGSSQAAN